MKMERSYINEELGFACCCWEAPSREELANLFAKAGTVYTEMIPVHEYGAG